jgi:hypothetical protein
MPKMRRGKQHNNCSFSIYTFLLCLVSMIGIFYLAYTGALQGQAATTLIGIIVASLFKRGKT